MAKNTEHIKQFIQEFTQSTENDSFIKLVFDKYHGTEKDLKKVFVRLVEIRKQNKLSFLYRYKTKDITKNYPIPKGISLVKDILEKDFLVGTLFTTTQDIKIEIKGNQKITKRKPSFCAPMTKSHDRKKERLIEIENNIYLKLLGVINNLGEIREKQGDKYRQINKFIEVIDSVLNTSGLKGKKELSIVDMGSGKGYLTFALYDYINNTLNIKAKVTGVEIREDLIKLDNEIAKQANFGGLNFTKGYIKNYNLKQIDMLVALHACDTATDDAIYKGISSNIPIIITAPCCHKQIRNEIKTEKENELKEVLRHGILLERQAEMTTDVLRALYLKLHGYNTKIIEFISTEHTNKNIMIIGIKHGNKVNRTDILNKIENLKNFFGIKKYYLEELLK